MTESTASGAALLNRLSERYETGRYTLPLVVGSDKSIARLLGHDGTTVTGSNIARIECWKGYPIARLRRTTAWQRFMTPAMFINRPGMIVMVGEWIPGTLAHECKHFRDWLADYANFLWWRDFAYQLPVVGYIANKNEIKAYASQIGSLWAGIPSIDGPEARRFAAALRTYWGLE